MDESELLNAISKLVDSKFEEFKINMATKENLREVKDQILSEVTKVEEQSDRYYVELLKDMRHFRVDIKSDYILEIKSRLNILETDMAKMNKGVL